MRHFILLLIAIIFSNHSYAADFSKFRVVIFSKSGTYDNELGNVRFKKMILDRIEDLSSENIATVNKQKTMIDIVRFMTYNRYKFIEEIKFSNFTLFQPIHSKSDFYRLVDEEVTKILNSLTIPVDDAIEETESCTESDSIESAEFNEALVNNGYTDKDVLFGRGPNINNHPGNRKFRSMVDKHRKKYSNAKVLEKQNLAKCIISFIENDEGRFLRLENDEWKEVGKPRIIQKTLQALREKPLNS